MQKDSLFPDYIFESSWEVCNKVGGIYTVLSTRAKTLQNIMTDKIIFIGPDCWQNKTCQYFVEDEAILKKWRECAHSEGLNIRIGRWQIPGLPIAILVDFSRFYEHKNEIYTRLWEDYNVDSLHAYGDYDEASMFSYAAGKVVESYYLHNIKADEKVIYHGNEWMTGLGLLYINKKLPQIATIFTTHATSIGRSIAGNNKPLYDYLSAYNGDQMASELNMQSKHSIEKQTASKVDCFTTVSEITAKECKQLLDKPVDVVLPNGFNDNFVPSCINFINKRRVARKRLLRVANALLGTKLDDNTLIISTSGRYEFRNKGIDVFIELMNRLRVTENLNKQIVAFIMVPGWISGPREDLSSRLNSKDSFFDTPLENPVITHNLFNIGGDNVLNMMRGLGMNNGKDDKVKLIFVPCYIDKNDGIMNMDYYDILLGNDLTVYPSYYEPWGYTPLESIAFKVPCITTDLSGFGLWTNSIKGGYCDIADGVKVIHRTDYNYSDVAETIKDTVIEFTKYNKDEINKVRSNAANISKKALWSNFIEYYYDAYDFALKSAIKRNK